MVANNEEDNKSNSNDDEDDESNQNDEDSDEDMRDEIIEFSEKMLFAN